MLILGFIKNILRIILAPLRTCWCISRIRALNPSCCISLKCNIAECNLGQYVAVFDNVSLYKADIGAYSYIQVGSRIFNCKIGKFCSIAPNVTIAPGMHDINFVSTHPTFSHITDELPKNYSTKNDVETSRMVNIGNDVWIGERAIILDGVVIGNGAVIAAGAVVTKDVESYSVVGGVPAKHIKFRFDEEIRGVIERSYWWDNTDEWFIKNVALMSDTDLFLKTIYSQERPKIFTDFV